MLVSCLLIFDPSDQQTEQAGNTMNINVPQVQLINPENQIVEVRYSPLWPLQVLFQDLR